MEPSLIIALTLIILGVVLLAAELFLPTGGILSVLALAAIVVGVAVPFYYNDTSLGMYLLLGVAVTLPVLIFGMFQFWRRTPLGRRMFLRTSHEDDMTMATMPVNLELEQLRGRVGQAVSALRPSGVVEFDGKRVDCLSEGMMVEQGTWVKCIDVKVGRVLVRPVPKPDLRDLEKEDF